MRALLPNPRPWRTCGLGRTVLDADMPFASGRRKPWPGLVRLHRAFIQTIGQASPGREIVGVVPWLPWPLSAWGWWTEPVRAERLALLRIGVALCLIAD